MRREQIIAIVVVVLLAAGAGAGYQFYMRPALEKFAADQQYLTALNTKLSSLKSTFGTGKPEATVERVKEKTQPWRETIEQRARQFTLKDFKKIDELPKTEVLKAYYAQASQKMVADLLTELAVKGVYYGPQIDFYFQMARPDTLEGRKVNALQVIHWLSTIKLGTSLMRMLADSEMLGLEDFNMWQPRNTPEGFTSYAVGVSMWMTMDQFCKFMDKLYSDESMCISVNGFRIMNTALRAWENPPLRIELVFQIDQYVYEPTPAAGAAKSAGTGGAGTSAGKNTNLQAMQDLRAAGGGQAGAAQGSTETSWWRKWLPF